MLLSYLLYKLHFVLCMFIDIVVHSFEVDTEYQDGWQV